MADEVRAGVQGADRRDQVRRPYPWRADGPDALARRQAHLPGTWGETVRVILAMDERCGRDRERVGGFLDAAGKVEDARDDLEAEARMRSMPAEQLPDWEGWRKDEQGILDEANAILEEIPERELVAHLASFGAGPEGIGEREEKIREQIARDEQARAAAEEERRAADAEDHRRFMERFQARMEAVKERAALRGRLRDCLGEREPVEARGGRFIHREDYPDWRSRAESLLAETNTHLDETEKLAPDPEKEPGVETLRTLSAALDRSLLEDSAEMERIRQERTEEEKRQQQDRSQDRDISW